MRATVGNRGLTSAGMLALALAACPHGGSGQIASVQGSVRNGGSPLADAAVYLIPEGERAPIPPDPTVAVDQIHLRFVPNVLVVPPGTEVRFFNSDRVLHNVFSPDGGKDGFDLGTYEQYRSRSHVFRSDGLHIVLCHIHPEMAAYVIVAPTAYKAVSDADGNFAIESVPPGRYRLHAWHIRRWRDTFAVPITVPTGGLTNQVITLGPGAGVAQGR